MRILVLTNMFPPHSYGGYELWCRDVVRRWRRAGHEVLVVTSDVQIPDTVEDPAADPGLEVRRRLGLYWADHEILDPPVARRLMLERHNQRVLDQALRSFRPDVVSAWAMGAMSLGLLTRAEAAGVPVVPVVCDEWPVYGPVVDGWSRLWASRPAMATVARLVTGLPCRLPALRSGPACFVSEAMRARAEEGSPWRFEWSVVVPSGIDRDDFPDMATSPPSPWRWRLLHVGRVDRRKGLGTVLEALAACPTEATLEMLGGGDAGYLAELEALAAELGVSARVRFGMCARRELAERYRSADAVVFAPVWDEPFGLVPLEAMACGTPVVASPTGGSVDFLHDDVNCVAFTPGRSDGLVAALERLAVDDVLRQRLVAEGRRTAARFDAGALADELLEWHERAVARGGP